MKKRTACILVLGMLLSSYKGYLALYETPDPEPKQIFPCAIESLPEADQIALKEGIRIRNQEALSGFLEDYLS